MSETGDCKDLIGVIHLPTLPGAPLYRGERLDDIIHYAVEEAERYKQAGFSAVIVENYGDKPFSIEVSKPQAVSLALIASSVRREVNGISVGVNVLRNDAYTALTIAVLAGLDYVRVNSLCEVRVSGEGILYPAARRLVEAARELNAIDTLVNGRLRILADVNVKHSMPLASYSVQEASLDCIERLGFKPWALVVSGSRTGEPPDTSSLESVAWIAHGHGVKVYVGSGVSPENIHAFIDLVDGFIIGSSVKAGARPEGRVDPVKASMLADIVRGSRGSC
ncbi:MAG: BtpA/SgcQ family protein [Desulfurococcales archaeon]|nr:BtpA/SgcQ family protein [Desulfurococcales archaeon]